MSKTDGLIMITLGLVGLVMAASSVVAKSECRVPLPPLPLALPDAVQFAPL